MLRIALDSNVRSLSMKRSRARDAYFNFLFNLLLWQDLAGGPVAGVGPSDLWCAPTFDDRRVPESRDWDNYRLLHYFDVEEGTRFADGCLASRWTVALPVCVNVSPWRATQRRSLDA
jgi:hypothetical protein